MYDLMIRLAADLSVIVIALVAVYVLVSAVPNKYKFARYSEVLMAGLTAYLAAKLIASVYQPASERPFEIAGQAAKASYLDNPGFPSDHALFAMALVLAVWLGARRPRVALVLFAITLVMCAGRVLAMVHTPLDVVGGLAIACVGVVWYSAFQQKFSKKSS
jgi:membrane-associated phospholipid phosphatase